MTAVIDQGGRSPVPQARFPGRARRVELALALLLTVSAIAIPDWWVLAIPWRTDMAGLQALSWETYWTSLLMLFALALALPDTHGSGICLGKIREQWRRVAVVTAGPPILVATVYPLVGATAFAGRGAAMWAIAPIAQNLIFLGFIYGRLERVLPTTVGARVPVRWALIVTCLCFGLFHLPNLRAQPPGFVAIQVVYTAVLSIVPGLSRQWTGSILYATACHVAINFIVWLN